jgi:hypothetical protein
MTIADWDHPRAKQNLPVPSGSPPPGDTRGARCQHLKSTALWAPGRSMMPEGVARRGWILIVIGLVLVLAGCKTGGGGGY